MMKTGMCSAFVLFCCLMSHVHSTTQISDVQNRLRQIITMATETVSPASNSSSDDMFCNYYTKWTSWNKCNKHCLQTRKRKCKDKAVCGKARFKEKRACSRNRKCPNHVLKIMGSSIRNRRIEDRLYDIFYKPWSEWSPCNRKCARHRRRRCKRLDICAGGYLEEQRPCSKIKDACKKSYTFVTNSSNKPTSSAVPQNVIATSLNITFKDLKDVCGIRPVGSTRTVRVVGGRESIPHSWPWQVEIVTKRKKHLCGGTLISPRWVLTAAHCLIKRVYKGAKMFVRLGEHNKKVIEGTENDFAIKNYHLHEDFDYKAVKNDIALLELDQAIAVTNITGYACLPTRKQRRKSHLCSTVGWGRTNITNRRGSKVLREVQIPIVKRKKCRKAFNFKITKFQICAGYKLGGKDACVGDSGGPLMCPSQFTTTASVTKWYVTGVTSYGEGCGQKNKFGIYVNVVRYISWIKNKISTQP